MAVNVGNVSVSLNRAHLSARLKRGSETAGRALAEQILGDCRPYVPFAQGSGKLDSTGDPEKIDGAWCVTWDTLYAAYQWYGCWHDGTHVIQNHDTSKHKKATTQWVDAAKEQYGEKWGIVAQKEHVKGGE